MSDTTGVRPVRTTDSGRNTAVIHMGPPCLRLKCLSESKARAFADYLAERDVFVADVEDDTVVVPFAGNIEFAISLSSAAVFGSFASGTDMISLIDSTESNDLPEWVIKVGDDSCSAAS